MPYFGKFILKNRLLLTKSDIIGKITRYLLKVIMSLRGEKRRSNLCKITGLPHPFGDRNDKILC